MNQDYNTFEKVDDEFQDDWLNQNLKFIQLDPPKDFTKKVVEQVEFKPNTLSNSPMFWILVSVPSAILVWFLLYSIYSINISYQINLTFIPNVSKIIPFYILSKYVLMIVFSGLFFFGLDYFLNKRLLEKQSFFSFMMV